MTAIQKIILKAGIRIKLDRGEKLDAILASYVNLTVEQKKEIKEELEV